MPKANDFTDGVFYQLKKRNCQLVDLYIRGVISNNVGTGKQTYPETRHRIKKAVVLPITDMKMFMPAQNFANAGRNMEYGGIYSLGTSIVLVEQKDLPDNYAGNTVDAFIINHRRFQIKTTMELQQLQSMMFTIEELKGQFVDEIIEVKQRLTLTDSGATN